jgi:hypothetical protein
LLLYYILTLFFIVKKPASQTRLSHPRLSLNLTSRSLVGCVRFQGPTLIVSTPVLNAMLARAVRWQSEEESNYGEAEARPEAGPKGISIESLGILHSLCSFSLSCLHLGRRHRWTDSPGNDMREVILLRILR